MNKNVRQPSQNR